MRIAFDRPEVRNAFRPQTLFELSDAFLVAREDPKIGVIVLTGEGREAFCSGGDQRVRGHAGYVGNDGVPSSKRRASSRNSNVLATGSGSPIPVDSIRR